MKYKLGEIASLITKGTTPRGVKTYDEGEVNFIRAENIIGGKLSLSSPSKRITNEIHNKELKRSILCDSDILITIAGTLGRSAMVHDSYLPANCNQAVAIVRIDGKDEVVNKKYILYYLQQINLISELIASSAQSVQPNLNLKQIGDIEINIPDIDTQNRIVSILDSINNKIDNNNSINKNLEDQLDSLFTNSFSDCIVTATTDNSSMLGELITIIDNRGKTPPLTTETFEFPIIDVGALKGIGRIVDFNNCTKFVDKDTYDTWFRNGHPKPWDILLSTVGSLAEMKLFLGSKGCIAQNVVALRATTVSPLYLYQYLKFIRDDLVAYNIGSVQPSIKVTHIIKHPIFVPDPDTLIVFEETAKTITDKLYANYNENESLKALRDSLLPKLMAGEIDVSNLSI